MTRFAVSGAAHPHVESFFAEAAARADLELVAVCDSDPAIAAALAERFGVPSFSCHEEMLTAVRPDAVAISAVYSERPQLIIESLKRGVHVAVDKPMATRLDDLAAIELATQFSTAHLSLVLEKRYYPATLALKEVLQTGALGRIVHISATAPHKLKINTRPEWFFTGTGYGGILGDLLTHDVDLALQFSGAVGGTVQAHAGNVAHPDQPEFSDLGAALFVTDDHQTISLDAHWLSPEAAPYHGDYRMQLVGTEGTADLFWKDDRLVVATHQRPPYEPDLPPARRPAEDFFDAIRDGRTPDCDTAQSIAVTRIALLAQLSADTGTAQRWSTRTGPLP